MKNMFLFKSFHVKRYTIFNGILQTRNYAKYMDKELKKCYNILGVREDSDQETIRATYLKLVKQYHPDSGTLEADASKFQEIDKAFKVIVKKMSKERWDADEVDFEIHAEEYDIKHTAPQHRQYLNYGGMGVGSPFEREKQYSKIRAMHAVENVLNHRLSRAQADEKTPMQKKPQKHKIKTKYGYDRLVEDLIQESMQKGEFDNLAGKGKPLKGVQFTNPYVDFVTHKINQVLIDNGFTPEWIMLQKEIREDKLLLQRTLHADRTKLGCYPFNNIDQCKWQACQEDARKLSASINKKIEKFNLVVPVLQKQMLLVNLKREAEKVAEYGQTKHDIEAMNAPLRNDAKENPKNIFSFFESFFYTK